MRNPDARLAALVGLIVGAFGHHAIESLVRMPPAVMIATAALFAAALVKSHERCALFAALIVGALAGCTLPAAPGVVRPVVTHATGRADRGDLFDALDNLDAHPAMLLGKRVWVTGVWRPTDRDALATVSLRVMACCAADAVDVGFDVLPSHVVATRAGARVRVGGVVGEVLREGETRYVLRDADVKPVNEESIGAR